MSKFKPGDKLIPKKQRTFQSLVFSEVTINGVTDDNYIIQTGLPLSKNFIENNYETIKDKTEIEDEIF